jgi:hypothetical protein
MEEKLLEIVKKYMRDNRIECMETIYQCDWVILSALPFIEDLYNVVKDDMNDFETT